MVDTSCFKVIDDYIKSLYKNALLKNKTVKNDYYDLKPLAYIILRSEIILDYLSNQFSMPKRANEIISSKMLSRIVRDYSSEEKLKQKVYNLIPNFYHRKFDGREGDWVFVAVWLWIESREIDIDPVKFFECDDVFEKSRMYIINKAESVVEPLFKEYFKGANYNILIDRYDISKYKVKKYLDKMQKQDDLIKEVKGLSRFDFIPAGGSYNPRENAVLEVLRDVLADVKKDEKLKNILSYKIVDGKGIYVVVEGAELVSIVHMIRDKRNKLNLKFRNSDLLKYLKIEKCKPNTNISEICELSFNTVDKYMRPSSGDTSPIK